MASPVAGVTIGRVGTSAFRVALVVAGGAHLALAAALVHARGERAPAQPASGNPETLFVLSEEPLSPPPPPLATSETAAIAAPAPAAIARQSAPTSTLPPDGPRSEPATPDGVPPLASSAAPWSLGNAAPLALGVDDYWKHVALEGRAPAPSTALPLPPPRSVDVDRILRSGLASHDQEIGLGASGPLVSAVHEAASMAPDVGSATLDIDVDAGGKVIAPRVVSANADMAGWNAMAGEVVRIASSKTIHVPAGSHGIRARLRVVAERTLPSGTKRTAHPGAAPDDVPGGMDGHACEGEGAERRCTAGMPVGVTGTLGDLANIGARAARIVHVAVLGEAEL